MKDIYNTYLKYLVIERITKWKQKIKKKYKDIDLVII